VDGSSPQVRLGKDSIGKVREEKMYGEFKNIQLTEEEYTKLVVALNENAVDTLITELDGYIESTGKKYKSHYATLQNWARRRIKEYTDKNTSKPTRKTL